ncbi:hypothetical protein Tco_0446260 [Tanacetum coccineum]
MLSEAQGVSLRITSSVRVRTVYHDLYLGGKTLVERDNVGFDLTKSDFCPSFAEDLTAKGVGLRVADSLTGNHRKDGFTPLETIRRFLGVIGSRSLSSSKGRPLSWRGGYVIRCDDVDDQSVILDKESLGALKISTWTILGCEFSRNGTKTQELVLQCMETASEYAPTPSRLKGDDVTKMCDVVAEYEIQDLSEGETEEEEEVEEVGVEYFDKFLTRDELAYHKYLLHDPSPSFFKKPLIIIGGNLSNLKIPCHIGNVQVWKAYIDLKSPVNIMTRMNYNWIMKKQLEPRIDNKDLRRISNFTGRIRGMHIFVGNFTYIADFLIVEDISLVINHCLSQVVLGEPLIETSNMTYDLSLGIVKFTNGVDEVAYRIPHKIEQF